MLSNEEIVSAVSGIAARFPLKRASYFGSYAEGRQTETSDLDLLVEFQNPAVSLFVLSAIKNDLEDLLKIPVDIVHAPVPDDSLLKIGKMVHIYG